VVTVVTTGKNPGNHAAPTTNTNTKQQPQTTNPINRHNPRQPATQTTQPLPLIRCLGKQALGNNCTLYTHGITKETMLHRNNNLQKPQQPATQQPTSHPNNHSNTFTHQEDICSLGYANRDYPRLRQGKLCASQRREREYGRHEYLTGTTKRNPDTKETYLPILKLGHPAGATCSH